MKRFSIIVLGLVILTAPAVGWAIEGKMTETTQSGDITQAALDKLVDFEKSLGLKFTGDVRFRVEYFVQDQDYSPTHITTPVRFIDHEFRYRVRARLGVEKTLGDGALASLRLATASSADASSPDVTLSGAGVF